MNARAALIGSHDPPPPPSPRDMAGFRNLYAGQAVSVVGDSGSGVGHLGAMGVAVEEGE